jgi:hypothetical protein
MGLKRPNIETEPDIMLMESALEEISFGGTYFHDLCKTRFLAS